MKTAISLPDEVFERATRRAAEMGLSRSELFALSVTHYLDERERGSVTNRIDAALERIAADDSNAVAASAGRRVLDSVDDEW